MTDRRSPFEHRVARALESLRPADGAPAAVRDRVLAVTARPARSPWLRWRRPIAGAALTLGALAVALVAIRPGLVGMVSSGSGNAPAPTVAFDPAIEGPGIWRVVMPLLPIGFVLAAMVVASFGVRWVLRARGLRASMLVRGAIVAGVCAGIAAPGFEPGFEPGSSHGPVLGLDLQAQPPPGVDGPAAWYETAQPGGPIALMLSIRNPGPLPIRFEGVVETETGDNPIPQRWTAVWLARDPNEFPNPTDRWEPFAPTTVEPGQEMQINLVGRAGSCAFGPGFTLDTLPDAFASRTRTIRIVYSLFGLTQTADYEMPMQLVEPYAQPCPSS